MTWVLNDDVHAFVLQTRHVGSHKEPVKTIKRNLSWFLKTFDNDQRSKIKPNNISNETNTWHTMCVRKMVRVVNIWSVDFINVEFDLSKMTESTWRS